MFLSLLLASALVAAAPAPSPPSDAGTRFEQTLRRLCISNEGLAVAMEFWRAQQATLRVSEEKLASLNAQLHEAASASPINVGRIERAVRARDSQVLEMDATVTALVLGALRRLSGSDQVIFARNLDFRTGKLMPPLASCEL